MPLPVPLLIYISVSTIMPLVIVGTPVLITNVSPVPVCELILDVFPVERIGPAVKSATPTPVAPVAPVAPVTPVGPVGPVGPVTPVGPVGPVAPVTPVTPVGPTCVFIT